MLEMIYTSYFPKIKELEGNGIVPVAVCAKVPDWYSGLRYSQLAPSYDILMDFKRVHDCEQYKLRYHREILDRLSAARVVDALETLSSAADVALICYERPDDFCHRHLVADWLNHNGFSCAEWGV